LKLTQAATSDDDQGIGESYYKGFGQITGKQPWSAVSVKEIGAFSTSGDFVDERYDPSTIQKMDILFLDMKLRKYY
jgi:hypothetical protein